jgi:peptide/nickel transport system permease protein
MSVAAALLFLRRLGGLIGALIAAAAAVFLLLDVIPGDPAALILGVNARPDTLAALHHALGLDEPAPLRFLHWLWRFFRGDFGESYTYHVPIRGLIAERLGVSLPLAALAVLLSTAFALPVGVFAAARFGRWADRIMLVLTQLGLAVPNFWLGLLLVLVFALWLAWLPASGFPGWRAGGAALRALLLPAIALALPQAAILARIARAAMLEALSADYIRTARAKGASERRILWRHALPNALLPILTILGLQFSSLLAGTIIIENVFTLPGLGRLLFQAISGRDLPVVQTLVVLLAMAVIAVNFAVDLLHLLVDPRLRREGGR